MGARHSTPSILTATLQVLVAASVQIQISQGLSLSLGSGTVPGAGDRAYSDTVLPRLHHLKGRQDKEETAAQRLSQFTVSPPFRHVRGFQARFSWFQSPPSLFLGAQAALSRQGTVEGCGIVSLGGPSLEVKKQQISFSLA